MGDLTPRRLARRLLAVGARADEGAHDIAVRQTLVLGAVLMSLGGLLWGALTLGLGMTSSAAIPLGYVVISAINLGVLARTRVFPRARTVQVFISLLLPFLFQWVLGGFALSGGVMLWAMIALVGSLTLSSGRQACAWLFMYCALTVVSGVFDADLAAFSGRVESSELSRLFYTINIVTISSIVFTLGLAITQGQRRGIEALEAGQRANNLLTQKLGETVATRELDIERLRVAEMALTEFASALEEQVRVRTAELELALVRAEAGTRAKSEFLAVMSHEVRTPLNGILGTTDLLQLTPLDPDQKACVGLIRRSGDLLLSIINDVLDFSKIEAGRLDLSPRPFDLREELEGVAALHRANARERGVEVSVSMSPEVPSVVVADADRLLQIVGNLVGNAVKFTHEGRVVVRLATRSEGADLRLDFSIADTGIGIPADSLSRLFQPFSQADSSTTRRYGGTGLGLVICARLIDMMGGRITVESEVGRGTTFRFDIRAALPDPLRARSAVASPVPSPDFGGPLQVLLAEDNAVNQQIGMRMLRKLGCEASIAGDGAVAASMAGAAAFDLVLMDMHMPVLDGLAATRLIRAMPLEHQPRIVALTANAFASDRDACVAAGMDEFMAKPLRLELLREELTRVRARRKPRQRPRSNAPGPAVRPVAPASGARSTADLCAARPTTDAPVRP